MLFPIAEGTNSYVSQLEARLERLESEKLELVKVISQSFSPLYVYLYMCTFICVPCLTLIIRQRLDCLPPK